VFGRFCSVVMISRLTVSSVALVTLAVPTDSPRRRRDRRN